MRGRREEGEKEDEGRKEGGKGKRERKEGNRNEGRKAGVRKKKRIGKSMGGAIGGAVLKETIYEFNGMGRVAVKSIQYLDFPVIMGVTLITAAIFLLSNLIVDILYAVIDPRVRLE